jgi:hypothetical protein
LDVVEEKPAAGEKLGELFSEGDDIEADGIR